MIPHTGGVAKQDLARGSNFASLWDHVNPDKPSRVVWHRRGGDPHPLVNGSVNHSFRRITVRNGDRGANDPSHLERVQLGKNSTSDSNTFKAYHAGQRWITYWSMRIQPLNMRSGSDSMLWEMYQQGGPGGPPSLQFRREPSNTYALYVKPSASGPSVKLWDARVPVDRWLRFAIDVKYTTNPHKAKIQLWGDLHRGRPSFEKLTPVIKGYPTIMPGARAVALIAGIYQDAVVPAHHIDVANWQVSRWAP